MRDIVLSALCALLLFCPLCANIPVLMRQRQMVRTWLCPLACADKSDAPSWRLCRPFISYTLLR